MLYNFFTYLENNPVQSSDVRKHIGQFLSHKYHAPSNQADIDRPADQWCHNLRPANRPCSNIGRPHMYHD